MRSGLLGCIALAAAVHAVAATVPPGTRLAAAQEMVRNAGDDPESLDPQMIESTAASFIVGDLFEGLVTIDNHGHIAPGVARSWEQVDPRTWLFHLRASRWSNGAPVTAGDFVYAWRRLVDPKTAAPLASTLGIYLLNGAQITKGNLPPAALGVRAVDDSTLEVKTNGGVPFLPWLLAGQQFAPVPRAVVEKFGRDWTRPANMVGNGAFTLKDWQVNAKVVVEKSSAYWDAAHVVLTRVTYLAVQDTNADLALYRSGENDFLAHLPAGTYESMKAQLPRDVHNGLLIALRFFALNNGDPLLKDVRVRKALSMVIDRQVLASKVTADGQLPVDGLTLTGAQGVEPVHYEWATWPMDRRVAEARALLTAAGVAPGTTLKLAYNTSDYQKKMAVFAASEWKSKLGLNTELESMEYKVLIQRRQSAQYQIARHAWLPGFADIAGILMLTQCGSDANDDKSCNRAADALIDEANTSMSPDVRKAFMTRAVRLVMDDYPMIPLLQITSPRLVKPYIGGYDDANDQDMFLSKNFYVIEH